MISRIVPGKQPGQGLLVELAECNQYGVERRTGAGLSLHQVEACSSKGLLETRGAGGRLTGEQYPRLGRCLLAHVPQRRK
jgi:hypothetical protein